MLLISSPSCWHAAAEKVNIHDFPSVERSPCQGSHFDATIPLHINLNSNLIVRQATTENDQSPDVGALPTKNLKQEHLNSNAEAVISC